MPPKLRRRWCRREKSTDGVASEGRGIRVGPGEQGGGHTGGGEPGGMEWWGGRGTVVGNAVDEDTAAPSTSRMPLGTSWISERELTPARSSRGASYGSSSATGAGAEARVLGAASTAASSGCDSREAPCSVGPHSREETVEGMEEVEEEEEEEELADSTRGSGSELGFGFGREGVRASRSWRRPRASALAAGRAIEVGVRAALKPARCEPVGVVERR